MITVDDGREFLTDAHEALVFAHQGAFEILNADELKSLRLSLGPSAMKSVAHDIICEQVGLRLPDGFEIRDIDGQKTLMRAGHNIIGRFKCLAHGTPRAYATDRQKLLGQQQFDERLTDSLGGTRPDGIVTIGYTLQNGWHLGRVIVRWDCVGYEPWSFDLHPDTTVMSEPLMIPTAAPRPVLIKAKKVRPATEVRPAADAAEGPDAT